ncbi:hypothetical protein [Mammaliicoccus sp. Dog046]|uniref:hypothetical protein n=1 Tax=Mammaliicoccus sp. Dog046 TaxID=3034233 RepID=UPI002B2606BE|nr:hypothetical protein [Mammaliicoccus sp. Dog046]WQK86177.1 hypothetical protein P3U32_03835 [Mammaliicoccus sp. Dog046]
MSKITKVLVGLAIVCLVIGIGFQISGHPGIKFTLASILFLIAAFINRSSDRKKSNK